MGRMNRNLGNQERDDGYQNVRGYNRIYQNRQPNLNPHYQNPVDLVRIHERNRGQGSEENIYERLDNDDDNAGRNGPDVERNDANDHNNDHTYERIDNRPWYRGNLNYRTPNYASNNLPGSSAFWNVLERNINQYEHIRDFYLSYQASLNRFSNLSRNCFSTDNVAIGSNANDRYVYRLGKHCMCQFCTRMPFIRYHICQHCNSFHDRLQCYDSSTAGAPGSSRHYIYQVSRSCRCTFCRGEYSYSQFPISPSRLVESLRRECQCRNPTNCNCRSRGLSTSNPAIYIGRIDRIGFVQSVNNPLYANPTIYVGRIERPCSSGLNTQDGAASAVSGDVNSINEVPSTSQQPPGSLAEPSTSGEQRNFNQIGVNGAESNTLNRQHTCDDFCIRNHPGNSSGLCQFSGRRGERPECDSGRISYHWWFVNRWLPSRGSTNERNSEAVPRVEEPRDPVGSDSDEP